MATRKQPRGICAFCDTETSKGAMTRHLQKCLQWAEAVKAAETKAKSEKEETLLYLRVEDAYDKSFWLDLEMTGTAPLKKLDAYLRAIWLECCGHLSEFSAGGWGSKKVGMAQTAAKAFDAHDSLMHIYDFGTSSETQIKLIGIREGTPLTKHPITLLARNVMPDPTCARCDEPATRLCMEPLVEEEPFLFCTKHAAKYKNSDYGPPIPLVNSPRLGLCGYTGPADPPY